MGSVGGVMIGDTRRLLRNLRKNHYETRIGTDSEGNVCWNVYRPQGSHDAAGAYTRNDAYVGTVQSINPYPTQVRGRYLCRGRPSFLFNEALTDKDLQKELKQVVESSARAKFVPKRV